MNDNWHDIGINNVEQYFNSEKAKHFWEQSQECLKSSWDAIDIITSKAFQLMSLFIALESAIAGYLITNFNNIDLSIKWSLLVMGFFVLTSIVLSLLAYLPKELQSPGMKPKPVIKDGYVEYQREIDFVYYYQAIQAQSKIDINEYVSNIQIGKIEWAVRLVVIGFILAIVVLLAFPLFSSYLPVV